MNNGAAGDEVVDVWEPGIDHTVSGYAQESFDALKTLRLVGGLRAEWNQPREAARWCSRRAPRSSATSSTIGSC